jgi:hypothetical protein
MDWKLNCFFKGGSLLILGATLGVFAVGTTASAASGATGTLVFSTPVRIAEGINPKAPNIDSTTVNWQQAVNALPIHPCGRTSVGPGSGKGGLFGRSQPIRPSLSSKQTESNLWLIIKQECNQGSPAFGLNINASTGSAGFSFHNYNLFNPASKSAYSKTTECSLSGANLQEQPTCASLGIKFDSAAGTVTFDSTQLYDGNVPIITVTGTLTFPAY